MPEERRCFHLTVANLMLPPQTRAACRARRIYALLYLIERALGGNLSIGEQQMLAIARITAPAQAHLRLSRGLAPVIVRSPTSSR